MRRLLLSFILCLTWGSTLAQVGYAYHLRYLTTEEGLSQNTVDDLMRDRQGFLWIATWNGLCRYDGYTFKVLKAEDEAGGLPDNFVKQVCEGPLGRLWIGTAQGLALYDLAGGRFEALDWAPVALREADIGAIAQDDQGQMWIGTDKNGLFRVVPAAAVGQPPVVHHLPLEGQPVFSLLPRPGGDCLLGTHQQFMHVAFDGRQLRQVASWPLPIPDLHAVRAMWQDPAGPLWVGTEFGLFCYEDLAAPPRLFLHHPDEAASLLHNTVTSIARDVAGNLLIGTLGGLCTYRGEGRFAPLQGRPGVATQLNNPFVNSLLCDTLGNVWIGTEKGGLNTYNLFQKKFGHLTQEKGNPHSLSDKTVNSVLAEASYLWVGTAGGGLNRVDRASGEIAPARHDPHRPQSLSSDFITAIHRDRAGDLWVATWGGGLNRMINGQLDAFARYSPAAAGVGSDFISSMVEDPRGFWLVGSSAGLMWFDPAAGTFGRVPLNPWEPGEPVAIGCILLDQTGHYWVGTTRGGYRFAASALAPGAAALSGASYFSLRSHRERGMSGDYIISLHEDATGQIWLGTFGSGLLQAQIAGDTLVGFEAITQADGLCNNTIYSIEGGPAGALWLSTDYGLARFEPSGQAIVNYYRSDGLLDNQFYWGASDRDEAGHLYFGGVSGLSFFDPAAIAPYPFAPAVAITDFKVMNRSLEAGARRHGQVAMTRTASLADTVRLSYRDNVFSIEFASLGYYLPERLTYQYRIAGVDPGWVQVPASRHFASYTNLSGGSYRFEVQAINEDGQVSPHTASLWVLVRPPWWQTTWFKVLLGLALLVLVMAYIRLRTHYLHQQKAKLEQEVHRRTEQIEAQKAKLEKQKVDLMELNEQVKMVNQLRLRFFTNISHEFRTPLTLIVDPVRSLLEQYPADSATGRTLRIVHRNAQRLLHLINQLMHFRRLESGKLKVQASPGDLRTWVQEVFASFSQLADQRRVDYRWEVSGQPAEPTWFDAEKLENVLFNLLGNAFKYSPEGARIRLRMIFVEKAQVRFLVEDTGPGIPVAQQAYIFDHFYRIENQANRTLHGSGIGLALCKELVEGLHGRLWVESEPGRGSTFGLEIPYGREAFASHELSEAPPPYQSNLSTQVSLAGQELEGEIRSPDEASPSGNRQHPLLLIVEDNHDLRAFLTESLQGQYRILGAANGRDGLDLARKYTPDLIVSDVMMPIMDGLELCSRLKAQVQTSHIPVILLTARDAVAHWVEGLETGADDYMPKPFDLRILQTRIDNLIASRQQLKRLFSKGEMPAAKEVSANALDREFLQKVYDQLEARAMEPDFSHDELAEAMCMSRSLLYKKLKDLSGLSVTEFINSYRLKQACALLDEGAMNISEVAYSCGFNDPKYFSRVFRKYYGMSPSEYAQNVLESA